MIQAVILCGGKGTRLASLYSDRPKILVPVAGRPFIEWQLEWLGRQEFTDIHLAGGYKAEVLEQWLREESQRSEAGGRKSEVGDQRAEATGRKSEARSQKPGAGIQNPASTIQHPASTSPLTPHSSLFTLHLSRFTFHISLSAEPMPLGTGGGLRYTSPWLRGNDFLAINGDSITPNLDLRSLVNRHRDEDAAITIAVSRIEETGRYGTVEFDDLGRVTAFREKEDRSGGWINTGVYLVKNKVLESIPREKPVSLETEIFPALVKAGQVYAASCPPPMLDMGTPEGIRALEQWLGSAHTNTVT